MKIVIVAVVLGLIGVGLFYSQYLRKNDKQISGSIQPSVSPIANADKTVFNELQFASRFVPLVKEELVGEDVKITVEESDGEQMKTLLVEVKGDEIVSDEVFKLLGDKLCKKMSQEEKDIYILKIISQKNISTSGMEYETAEKSGRCK